MLTVVTILQGAIAMGTNLLPFYDTGIVST
jgi:hypothetical protein